MSLNPRYLLFILLASISARAQTIVKGIVVDSASFAPLAFVNIQLKNTRQGTTTDSKGNFGILARESDTLVFSLVGYERLEFPLAGYEPSLIRMVEKTTVLPSITVDDSRIENPYEGMFEGQGPTRLKAGIPFYYSKGRKDRVMAGRWRQQALHVQTYVEVVINDPETKSGLMKSHDLTEKEYYDILTRFNEKHYEVMYFLTAAELKSFLNRFFEQEAR